MEESGEDVFNIDMIMHEPGFDINRMKKDPEQKTEVKGKSNLLPFQRIRTKKNKKLILKKRKEKSK